MKKILLFLLLSFQIHFLTAQSDLLAHFSGQQIENFIRLDFTVHGGVTCSTTEIQRSTDSIHFETIGIIPGICGSGITDESYIFDDSTAVKNQFNFYRITFGQLGNSQVIALKYIDYGNEFAIVPNADGVTIFFSNFNHQKLTLSLYNLQGQKLQTLQINGDAVFLSKLIFPACIYFFQVGDMQKILFSGKIVFH